MTRRVREMRRSRPAILVFAALVLGAALLIAPAISDADTIVITSITVTNATGASFTGCITGASCPSNSSGIARTWDLGPAGIVLTGGQSLVLTANEGAFRPNPAPTNGLGNPAGFGAGLQYSFDTTDFGHSAFNVTINAFTPVADSAL